MFIIFWVGSCEQALSRHQTTHELSPGWPLADTKPPRNLVVSKVHLVSLAAGCELMPRVESPSKSVVASSAKDAVPPTYASANGTLVVPQAKRLEASNMIQTD